MKRILWVITLAAFCQISDAQGTRHRQPREAFETDTPMVHDPVMAKEGDTYYIYSTGMGIQQMTSRDRKKWTVSRQPVMTVIPGWTTDSVPGFSHHVWAPDIVRWHDRWWMAYSCSTFGRNGSAIGLLSSRSLRMNLWKDEGCIVCSHEWQRDQNGQTRGDNWNAIDPNFVIDPQTDTPWLVWGSFWDGIQLARLDSTMHLAGKPVTIARRHRLDDPNAAENPTSKYVGRSKTVSGPYLDREGRDMLVGGGTLVLEGDKEEWEAAGHCAVYTFDSEDVFICHGYSAKQNGTALLIQYPIVWTSDGWPELKKTNQ